MNLRPLKAEEGKHAPYTAKLIKPADKTKIILFMMKSLGYSETKATRLAGM